MQDAAQVRNEARPISSGLAIRAAFPATLIMGAALLVAPWFGHFDDTDAQLYQVVVRKMAHSGAFLDPRYLEHLYPHFREHLPFGLWPFALATIASSERAAPAVAALFSLTTLVGVAAVGTRLFGRWPTIAATLVLATSDTFFRYGGAVRLDPALMLLSNAAAVPALLGWTSRTAWLGASGLAATAMLVKPPFGLIPFIAAAGSSAVFERSWRPVLRGMLGALLACIPLVAFLLLDRLAIHGGWWDGYLRNQVLASAFGNRPDGSTEWWFPLATIAGRFWPGMALVGVAVFLRDRRIRNLCLFCALMVLMLCLPSRKVWNHALVAYPGLAVLGGAAVVPAAAWLDRRRRYISAALVAASVGVWIAAPLIGRAVDGRSCIGAEEFAEPLARLAPGQQVLVVSSPTSWRMIASLAAERGLEPDPRAELPDGGNSQSSFALVQEELVGRTRGWEEVARARGWLLLRPHEGTIR